MMFLRFMWMPLAVLLGATISLLRKFCLPQEALFNEIRLSFGHRMLTEYTVTIDRRQSDSTDQSASLRDRSGVNVPLERLHSILKENEESRINFLASSANDWRHFIHYDTEQLERERHMYQNQQTSMMPIMIDLLQRAMELLWFEPATTISALEMQQNSIILSLAYYISQDARFGKAATRIAHGVLEKEDTSSMVLFAPFLDGVQMTFSLWTMDQMALKKKLLTYLDLNSPSSAASSTKNNTATIAIWLLDVQSLAISGFLDLRHRKTMILKEVQNRLHGQTWNETDCSKDQMATLQGYWDVARIANNLLSSSSNNDKVSLSLWIQNDLCPTSFLVHPLYRPRPSCRNPTEATVLQWVSLLELTRRFCPDRPQKSRHEWLPTETLKQMTMKHYYQLSPSPSSNNTVVAPFWNLGLPSSGMAVPMEPAVAVK